jgi:hypothetical protein
MWSNSRANRRSRRLRDASRLTRLGNTLYGDGDLIAAEVAYRKACRRSPRSMRPQLQLVTGLLGSQLGHGRRARRMLRRAAAADAGTAEAASGMPTLWDLSPHRAQSPATKAIRPDHLERLRRLAETMDRAAGPEHAAGPGQTAEPGRTAGTGQTAGPGRTAGSGRAAGTRRAASPGPDTAGRRSGTTSPSPGHAPDPGHAQNPRPATLQPIFGAFPLLLGILSAVAGIVILEELLLHGSGHGRPPGDWLDTWPVLLVAVLGVLGVRAYPVLVARRADRHHLRRTGRLPAEDESFVLYLRSFGEDRVRGADGRVSTVSIAEPSAVQTYVSYSGYGIEEQLVAAVRHLGRVLAVGTRGQLGPPAGCERLPLFEDDWQGPVQDLMSRARLVILVLDPTPGTLWEFVTATQVVEPRRLVLVATDEAAYERFRREARAEQERRAGETGPARALPEYVPPRDRLKTLPLSGLITYSDHWTPAFDPFGAASFVDVPAQRIREHMEPVLRRLGDHEKEDPGAPVRRRASAVGPPRRPASPAIRAAYAVACVVAAAFLFLTRHIWASDPEEIWAPAAVLAASALSGAASALRRRRI